MLSRLRSSLSSPDQSSSTSHILTEDSSSSGPVGISVNSKRTKLSLILRNHQVDTSALRELVWGGCPVGEPGLRALSWKILLGYLPTRSERQSEFLSRKRREYISLRDEFMHVFSADISAVEDSTASTLRQIRLDIPRTYTGPEFATIIDDSRLCGMLERVLFLFAHRTVACGYVQGHNDLAIPLLVVLITAATGEEESGINAEILTNEDLTSIECDLYFMFNRLLQDLLENYTFGQPGIQKMVRKIEAILTRIDPELMQHLEREQVTVLQLTFRWLNCLLTREFKLRCLLRCYDTLLSEECGFSSFLVYLCAALLKRMSSDLKRMDFQELMTTVSSASLTMKLDAHALEAILSEAFVLKSLFHSSIVI